jgi:hypothetical protein
MNLSRKSLLPLALVVGLFGTPTLGSVHDAGAHGGGVVHPSVVQLAADERGIRRRRRVRAANVRATLWRAVGRLRDAAKVICAAGESLQTRRPPQDSFARGPPRSSGI